MMKDENQVLQHLPERKSVRFGRSHIVHENAYRTMEPEELLGMISEHSDKETIAQLCKRKYRSDFSEPCCSCLDLQDAGLDDLLALVLYFPRSRSQTAHIVLL